MPNKQDKLAEIRLAAANIEQGFKAPEDWGASSEDIWEPFRLLGITSVENTLILDVGCGVGTLGMVLASKGGRVVGVDISIESLRIAKSRSNQKGLEFSTILADLESLPLKDSCFDLCVCSGVLHHFPSLDVVSELTRILKPNGKIFISEPNSSNPMIRLNYLLKNMIRPYLVRLCLDTPNEHLFSIRDYENTLRKYGITSITILSPRAGGKLTVSRMIQILMQKYRVMGTKKFIFVFLDLIRHSILNIFSPGILLIGLKVQSVSIM